MRQLYCSFCASWTNSVVRCSKRAFCTGQRGALLKAAAKGSKEKKSAASSRSRKVSDLQSGMERTQAGTPAGPELQPVLDSSHAGTTAAPTCVRLGIDPDNTGAVAVVSCAGLSEDCSSLSNASVEVHDMPTENFALGTRMRKQADVKGISLLLKSILAGRRPDQVHAVLEQPLPNHSNGKYSWFGAGYAFGAWSGALASHGIGITTVSARRWKADLQLNLKGKAGSRELAQSIFPTAHDLLRRIKDHGRAEAMLIAAWGLGVRICKPDANAAMPREEGEGGLVAESLGSLHEIVARDQQPADADPLDTIILDIAKQTQVQNMFLKKQMSLYDCEDGQMIVLPCKP